MPTVRQGSDERGRRVKTSTCDLMRLLPRQRHAQGLPGFTAGESNRALPAVMLGTIWLSRDGAGNPCLQTRVLPTEAPSVACHWLPEGRSNWSITLVIWVVVVLLVVSDVMVWAVSKTPGSKSPLLSSVCRKKTTAHQHVSQEALWANVAGSSSALRAVHSKAKT